LLGKKDYVVVVVVVVTGGGERDLDI